MPFSRMTDLSEIAAAQAAVLAAWSDIERRGLVLPFGEASCREWLAWIVVGLQSAGAKADLASLAVRQFLATVCLL